MKSISLMLLASGFSLLAVTPALATDVGTQDALVTSSGLYIRGDVGAGWLEGGETLGAIGLGIGYRYNENMRTDLRANQVGIDGGSTFTTILGNVYFDIPTDTVLTPYLGAGFGYGWAVESDGAAFSAMAGIDVSLTESLSLDMGYRYSQIVDEQSNEALLGLRFGF